MGLDLGVEPTHVTNFEYSPSPQSRAFEYSPSPPEPGLEFGSIIPSSSSVQGSLCYILGKDTLSYSASLHTGTCMKMGLKYLLKCGGGRGR